LSGRIEEKIEEGLEGLDPNVALKGGFVRLSFEEAELYVTSEALGVVGCRIARHVLAGVTFGSHR